MEMFRLVLSLTAQTLRGTYSSSGAPPHPHCYYFRYSLCFFLRLRNSFFTYGLPVLVDAFITSALTPC